MQIQIPKLSLVVLIGPSGVGKTTFAKKHFLPTEILSSDVCRGLVSNDENDQSATSDAFEILHQIAAKRLARGNLTVIDATNVQPEARKPFIELARKYHFLPVAIVLNLPESLCQQRNKERPDRNFGPHVIRQQRSQLRRSLRRMKREGFRHLFILDREESINGATIERVPLWNDQQKENGPFDIIGDIHGCCDELEALLTELGYQQIEISQTSGLWNDSVFQHPENRKAVFVGDLVDRGPRVLDTIRLVRNMVHHGSAFCVPGNHDVKLVRKLRGKNVRLTHGLAETMAEFDSLAEEIRKPFIKEVIQFLDGLISHYVFDEGRLVVAHAGLKEEMQGRGSGKVREFAIYGEASDETDEHGLPIRSDWAVDYRGRAKVVYGHTPVEEPNWLNGTVNIDTGCVFGGKLTALRYPEMEFVSIPARKTYCDPIRPFQADENSSVPLSAQQKQDDFLDAEDVIGKRSITTRLLHRVTIREENATAALEVMSRFAVNPQWLIYLPPTMSPTETSAEPGLLEHPAEAFSYFRSQGLPQVICQEKHMGSRAIVVLCRDQKAAQERFGIFEEANGIIYTRTGRRFFDDTLLEKQLLDRLCNALESSDFWNRFQTSWVCLDCELMPWSAKAQALLHQQYTAVGAAGTASLPKAVFALEQGLQRNLPDSQEQFAQKLEHFRGRRQNVKRFVEAYRQYCWPTDTIEHYRLAPFHLLATEGHVYHDKNHFWHLKEIAAFCQHDQQLLLATDFRVVDLLDEASRRAGIDWWFDRTSRGSEGMVVKPFEWINRGKKGLLQPAVKCRGKEYLRIIYGPDYDSEQNLSRLRGRSLGRKRSLALREFALGMEALERFVRREPLRRVHECVFGILALESEPVDPRL
ncbi:Polynucleotide kinase-phosphatase [Planctomycetales bacterium 10988]|nr:Polynucleotide kinase-phosphatase [Planctomycetales bacterium 10988]